MLERIHILNYKCLRDVTVELGDFTIFIGPNDSGKSSFLEVLQAFGKAVDHGYPAAFKDDHSLANLVSGKDPELHIVLEVEGTTPEHRFVYRLEFAGAEWLPRETLDVDGEKVLWTEEAPHPRCCRKWNRPPPKYSRRSSLVVRENSRAVCRSSAARPGCSFYLSSAARHTPSLPPP